MTPVDHCRHRPDRRPTRPRLQSTRFGRHGSSPQASQVRLLVGPFRRRLSPPTCHEIECADASALKQRQYGRHPATRSDAGRAPSRDAGRHGRARFIVQISPDLKVATCCPSGDSSTPSWLAGAPTVSSRRPSRLTHVNCPMPSTGPSMATTPVGDVAITCRPSVSDMRVRPISLGSPVS